MAIRIPQCEALTVPEGDGRRTDCHVGLWPPRNDSGGRRLVLLIQSVDYSGWSAWAVPRALRDVLFLLGLDLFGQLRQVHPPLGLMLELGFQVGELLL